MNFKKLTQSFRHAFVGLKIVFKEEQNFRIEAAAAVIALGAAWFLGIRGSEAAALILMILIVLVLELINSVFERLSDLVKPRMSHYVKEVKDIMAGAVLIAAVSAVILGLVIFLPHFR